MDEKSDCNDLRVLRWRCRRGMRELDVVLTGWLDGQWAGATEEERRAFARLLEHEDDRLLAWLVGRSTPPQQDLKRIVEVLRERPGT